jgi:hypothetical protein
MNGMALHSGPEQYQGFLKEILDLLAKDLEFDYFIEEDLNHGYLVQDGNWTGLIGSLVDQVRKISHNGRKYGAAVKNCYFLKY